MTINGRPVTSSATFEVLNPATEEAVGLAPDCSGEQLDEAMRAAAQAFPAWSDDAEGRRTALLAAAKVVRDAAPSLGPIFTQEQGRPLSWAAGEIRVSADWLDYYAGLVEPPTEVIDTGSGPRFEVSRRPIGPVGAITPWNAPVLLGMWKISAALAAGNTMVLKPSPFTPLTTLALGSMLADVLPPGVLNVISGLEPLGQNLVAHPVPRKISFTGSVPTGKSVAIGAAADLKRVTLELGGNDAAIVLDDADITAIAARIYGSAFANSGQICEAIKRVYVPASLHDNLVDALAACARSARVGNGLYPNVDMGPLTIPAQRDRIDELVADAAAHGGRIAAGGHRVMGRGYFFEPTIVTGVSDGVRLVDEEQFGPALPVISYSKVDDAIARANSTMYGLSASVWSADEDRARAVARRVQSGRVRINGSGMPLPYVPFGGVKWSGVGVENGPYGLHEYTDLHVTEIYSTSSGGQEA